MNTDLQTMSDDVKQWVCTCLLNEVPPQEIARLVQTSYGIEPGTTMAFIQGTQASPMFAAAQQVQTEMNKRDWLLANLRKAHALHRSYHKIERVGDISPDDFFTDFYSANRPCVLTNVTKQWPAMQKWSLDYLKYTYGHLELEVQTNREKNPRYDQQHTSHAKAMPFALYVDMVASAEHTNDFYMTSRNMMRHGELLKGIVQDVSPLPDILNENYSGTIAFLWVGPKGARTQLHHDMSNNLHVIITGQKRLLMADPYQLPFMYHHNNYWGGVPYPDTPDLDEYPRFADAQFTEVFVNPGEGIFIPVLWWHYVEATQACISVAFNNFRFPNHYQSFEEGVPFSYHQNK
ncbi:MAG: cupin-like domain-containing protein [Cyanobacteria bacterium HKST-UBA04]|nr:cupin-like domain-containing protein [Cyanobacteria bacterium HKST-UBA04]MCA9841647.1 cupin-like domain-containing protein [Cyanobacteria bacterium HKST-UBA03]